MLIDFRLGRQPGQGRTAGGHAHDGTDRRRGAGIHLAPLPEHGRIVLHHRLRNRLMLVPADLGQVAHPVLHIVPEGFQVIQQTLAPLGQIALLPAFGQHVQDDGVGIRRIGIPGAVPAVMADIDGLIAPGNGRERLRGKVQQAVQAGRFVPVRTHFLADAVALCGGSQAGQKQEQKSEFFHGAGCVFFDQELPEHLPQHRQRMDADG